MAGVGSLSSKGIKKVLLSPWMAVITFAILALIKVADPRIVESTRLNFYDQLMLSDKPTVSDDIVLVNISEKTLEQYGQYPFSRDIYAKIFTDLYSNGAGVVGSTILYPETDRFGGDKVLSENLTVAAEQTLTVNLPTNNNSLQTVSVVS